MDFQGRLGDDAPGSIASTALWSCQTNRSALLVSAMFTWSVGNTEPMMRSHASPVSRSETHTKMDAKHKKVMKGWINNKSQKTKRRISMKQERVFPQTLRVHIHLDRRPYEEVAFYEKKESTEIR